MDLTSLPHHRPERIIYLATAPLSHLDPCTLYSRRLIFLHHWQAFVLRTSQDVKCTVELREMMVLRCSEKF